MVNSNLFHFNGKSNPNKCVKNMFFFIEKNILIFIIKISTINSEIETFITKFELNIAGKKQLAEWMI